MEQSTESVSSPHEQMAFDPKQGDLWRDRAGHLWFVISEQSGDFDFDMVCETGSTGYPNDVESQFGPLAPVHRNEAHA